MAILHTIKAQLYDNALTENPNDLVARVKSERSLSVADICNSAAARGGADISAPAMNHAVSLWLKEMGYSLCDGFSVNADGWFTASPHVKGVFDSPTEKFNPEKHRITFEFQQGAVLRKETEGVTVEILGVADASLTIAQVTDVRTGSVNDLLTPGRNLRIAGHKLKIAGNTPLNGVYFINQTTQDRTRVEPQDIVTNNPSELMIVIPELAKGTYLLEVITQYGGNTKQLLNEPRTALFDRVLTVS
jgi:hypothetical protein